MPKNYKLQILWSRRTSPECIDHMLQDERINCLIEKGHFRCRIGSLTGGFKDDLGKTLIVPMEPHGLISDMYIDNGKWYGDVIIPEVGTNWIEMVDIMKEPVLHPLMIGNDSTGEYRLVHFGILEKSMLDPNCVYDGIHYDVPNHFDGDTINVLGIGGEHIEYPSSTIINFSDHTAVVRGHRLTNESSLVNIQDPVDGNMYMETVHDRNKRYEGAFVAPESLLKDKT